MSAASLNQRQGILEIGPNRTVPVSFMGSYIVILTNTTLIDVLVCVDQGTTCPVKAGIGFPTMRLSADKTTLIPSVFQLVEFTNSSDTETMVIEYFLSLGPVSDTRTVVSGYLQMDLSAPKLQTAAALNVQTNVFSVLALNALVKERVVQNNGDAPVWWGDENTDPATKRGLCIYPGGAAVINCWGAVYFKAEDAETTLSVVNVLKVA
jgi:hypothetical protein